MIDRVDDGPTTPRPGEDRDLGVLFEKAPMFMAVLDGPQHIFTMANRAYRETFGNRDLIGRTVREAFAELEGQGFFELIREAYSVPKTITLKGSRALVTSAGGEQEERFFDLVYQPIEREDGSISGIFVQGVDVTTYKLSERRDALLVRLDDAVRALSNPEEIVSRMMQLLCEDLAAHRTTYFDLDPEGRMGIAIRDHVQGMRTMVGGSYTLEDYGSDLAESMRAGRPYVLNDVADGNLTPAEVQRYAALEIGATIVFPLQKEGQLIAILAVYNRVPRRWRPLEVELTKLVVSRCWEAVSRARAFRALHQADRRKDEFIATLAHELRNPLAPLRTGLTVLSQGHRESDHEDLILMMERQVDHLVHLVDDLLDVSRVTQGKIEIERVPVELGQAIVHAVEFSRSEIESRSHRLAVRQPSQPVTVRGDLVRLTQVFANLLNNAAKYTPDGGSITISLDVESEEAVVRVIDSGIGIDQPLQAEIFEIFSQGPGVAHLPKGGLGIGLALVRKLVQLHGGTVSVHSLGASTGSTFEVRLPTTSSVACGTPVVMRTTSVPLRVLAVDDNRDAADSLAHLLSSLGMSVEVAYRAEEALERLERFHPAVALVDIGLPDMDGYELARRVRQMPHGKALMLVALTGWGQEDDRRRSLLAGFDRHLVKPVTLAQIQDVLGEAAAANQSFRAD